MDDVGNFVDFVIAWIVVIHSVLVGLDELVYLVIRGLVLNHYLNHVGRHGTDVVDQHFFELALVHLAAGLHDGAELFGGSVGGEAGSPQRNGTLDDGFHGGVEDVVDVMVGDFGFHV